MVRTSPSVALHARWRVGSRMQGSRIGVLRKERGFADEGWMEMLKMDVEERRIKDGRSPFLRIASRS